MAALAWILQAEGGNAAECAVENCCHCIKQEGTGGPVTSIQCKNKQPDTEI